MSDLWRRLALVEGAIGFAGDFLICMGSGDQLQKLEHLVGVSA